MKLHNLTKNMSDMTDEELREHVKHIRHNKYAVRPAKVKRIAEVEKKVTRKKVVKVTDAINKMSAEERQQLLLQLEGDTE